MNSETPDIMEQPDMTPNATSDRHSSKIRSTDLGGIDLSSWLSWTSYGLGFGLAVKLASRTADDLLSGGLGAYILIGSVVIFFGSVLLIQKHMSISLRSNTYGSPKRLVDNGVFAISRNPIYLAFLVPIGSLAYYSPVAAAAAAVIYIVSMNVLVISVEEQTLEASFGDQFRRYRLATPRWLIW
jgi:protein-S-isoprenylcysteine O-methyltransferase Ste14